MMLFVTQRQLDDLRRELQEQIARLRQGVCSHDDLLMHAYERLEVDFPDSQPRRHKRAA